MPGNPAACQGCKPQLVVFPTYSRSQIRALIERRLQRLPGPVFELEAINLCASKVGSFGQPAASRRQIRVPVLMLVCAI